MVFCRVVPSRVFFPAMPTLARQFRVFLRMIDEFAASRFFARTSFN